MTKVEALRQAQLDLIRGSGDILMRRSGRGIKNREAGSEAEAPISRALMLSRVATSHPYFGAPFILVGVGR